MPKITSNSYIKEELAWLDSKVKSMQQYVDSNPIDKLTDRIVTIGSSRAPREIVTANVEQQIKSIREVLKDIPPLLEAIDKLREKDEQKKIAVRGGSDVPEMMQRHGL